MIFIAFDHHDLIRAILFDMFDYTESCAGPLDKIEPLMVSA